MTRNGFGALTLTVAAGTTSGVSSNSASPGGEREVSRISRLIKLILILLLSIHLGVESFAADAEEAQYNVVVTLYNAGQWQAAVTKIEEREKLTLTDPMRAKYLCAK